MSCGRPSLIRASARSTTDGSAGAEKFVHTSLEQQHGAASPFCDRSAPAKKGQRALLVHDVVVHLRNQAYARQHVLALNICGVSMTEASSVPIACSAAAAASGRAANLP